MLSGPRAALALVFSFLPLAAQSGTSSAATPSAATPSGAAASPRPDDRTIHWQRSIADVEALATTTGAPLLLALNMDGESASDRVFHENWRDPRFVALTRRCLCVGASVFRHNAEDHDAHGRRVPCPRFPGLTCGEHIALEPELFARWFRDGERVAPRHALVLPGGRVVFDLSLCFDLTDVDRALAAGIADIVPWTTPAGSDWASLAARRDTDGRATLEAAVAAIVDPRTWTEALAAIAAHGDAGALDALCVALPRTPELPLAPLRRAAQQLGLGAAFGSLLLAHAQRVDGDLKDPGARADHRALLDALAEPIAGADAALVLRARTWRLATIALQPGAPDAQPSLLTTLLDLGTAACRGATTLPLPNLDKRELPTADALQEQLTRLDAQLGERRDDPELLAAAGIASLDSGRRQVDAPTATTQLLFEDAERLLGRALTLQPERFDWWLDRAHAAYYRQQFAEQREYGVRALSIAGFAWPVAAGERAALLQDARAIEAVRWLGDAEARLCTSTLPEDPLAAVATIRSAVLGTGLPAVSPFGTEKDWIGVASFVAALGLPREEIALLATAQQRLPAAAGLRQALYGALWRADRWRDAPALADAALRPLPTADGLWWSGHAHVLVAEELRRRERAHEAVWHYDAALPCFAAAAASNPAYADSVRNFTALSWLGRGLALAQGAAADRVAAAEALLAAAAMPVDFAALRDGLGYDALDLIDKVLEWRSSGPSPVDGMALLDRCTAAGAVAPLWAAAISDSLLREALRADGRNPERTEAETVDAAGNPIRMPMGLPTELGDHYLADAVASGRRAFAAAGSGELERQALAQALLITAERQLQRGRTDGVRAAAHEVATVLGLELAPDPEEAADGKALRAWLQPLRTALGPARPRQRDGR